jgi:hypothetical protein
MFDFNKNGRANTIKNLLSTALSNIDEFSDALKALILYSWGNNLQGERFWKNPNNEEILFIGEGEIISFKGAIATFTQGESKGMNYIKTLNEYTVLSGPNTGKVFDGGYDGKYKENYRPIQEPTYEENDIVPHNKEIKSNVFDLESSLINDSVKKITTK